MLGNLRLVLTRPLTIIGLLCLVALFYFHEHTSIYYYLTVAQLLYVPIIVTQLTNLKRWQKLCIILGQPSLTILYFTEIKAVIAFCAVLYLLSTLAVAWIGVDRFLKRGFVLTEEVMIDIGLIYLAMGGLWFTAFQLEINTGFSPIITWLTAIHFHYSAFLLCITVGLIGRYKITKSFKFAAIVIAAGPMLVAIGITFSTFIEIISVSLYVIALFMMSYYVMKWPIPRNQDWLLILAFSTLCFTIIWSFLYAFSNFTGYQIVDIPDMLQFHGLLNCIGFGGLSVLAWSIFTPNSRHKPYTFPTSKITGNTPHLQQAHPGLVDDFGEFVSKQDIPREIIHFYENTNQYTLNASVQWKPWFKPFAFVYQFISRSIGQLNLPFSKKNVQMDGEIWKVNQEMDGREHPRLWHRSINGKTVFQAIYSKHHDDNRCYMNIALPLPKCSMHGILALTTKRGALFITSDSDGDAGTYLSIGHFLFKLPIHEYFIIKEIDTGLAATHDMTIFGVPFLHIDYIIISKTASQKQQ